MNSFPRSTTGLVELSDLHLSGRNYLSGSLSPHPSLVSGSASFGSDITPFGQAYFTTLHDGNGLLEVNSISSSYPLNSSITDGIATIGLNYDGTTLQVVNGLLTVKEIVNPGDGVQFDTPLYVSPPQNAGDAALVKLAIDDDTIKTTDKGQLAATQLSPSEPLEISDYKISLRHDKTLEEDTDGALKVASGLLEGYGAISIIEDPLEFVPLDLPVNPAFGVVKLTTDGVTLTQLGDVLQGNYKSMPPISIVENEVSLRVDDVTLIAGEVLQGNYRGMPPLEVVENEISLQVDDVTLVAGPVLKANYMGMPPVVIEGNEVSLQLETTPGLVYDAGMLSLGLKSTNPGLLVDNEAGILDLDLIGGNGILVEENVINLDVVPGEGLVQYGNVWSAPVVGGEGVVVVWVPELGYEISAMPMVSTKRTTADESDPVETADAAPGNVVTSTQGGYKGSQTSNPNPTISSSIETTGSADAVVSTITQDFLGSTLLSNSTLIPVNTVLGGLLAVTTASGGLPPTTTIWGNNPVHSIPEKDNDGNIVQDANGQPQPATDPSGNPIPTGNTTVAISIDSDGNALAFTDTPPNFDPLSWLKDEPAVIPNLEMVKETINRVSGQAFQPLLTNQTNLTIDTLQASRVTLNSDPIDPADAASKSYADQQVGNVQTQVDAVNSRVQVNVNQIEQNSLSIARNTNDIQGSKDTMGTIVGQVLALQAQQQTDIQILSAVQSQLSAQTTSLATVTTNQQVDATNIASIQGQLTTVQSTVSSLPSNYQPLDTITLSALAGNQPTIKRTLTTQDIVPDSNSVRNLGSSDMSWSNVHTQFLTISSGVTGSLIPTTTSFFNLGTTAAKWSNLYVNSINGSALGSLAFKGSVDYSTADVINKPTLGSLAAKNSVDYSSDIQNKPDLSVYQTSAGLTALASDILPDATGTRSLGSTTKYWKQAYANAVYTGQLSSNGSGQVSLTATIVPATNNIYALGNSSYGFLQLYSTNVYANTLYAKSGNLQCANSLVPVSDNASTLGSSSYGWSSVYAYTIAVKTSITAPNLKALSGKDQADWNTDVVNRPTLGSLAAKNAVDWTTSDILNKPPITSDYTTSSRQVTPASTGQVTQTNYTVPPVAMTATPFVYRGTTYKVSSTYQDNALPMFDKNAATNWNPAFNASWYNSSYQGVSPAPSYGGTGAPVRQWTSTTTYNSMSVIYGNQAQLIFDQMVHVNSIVLTFTNAQVGPAGQVNVYGSINGSNLDLLVNQQPFGGAGVTTQTLTLDYTYLPGATYNYYILQVTNKGGGDALIGSWDTIVASIVEQLAPIAATTGTRPSINQPTLVNPLITGGLEMPVSTAAQLGPPQPNSRAPGSRVVLYPSSSNYVSPYIADYAIGMESAHMWFSTDSATVDRGFKFYGGNQMAARIAGTGEFEALKVITPSLELGNPAWNGSWYPGGAADTYIDFHATQTNGVASTDYDARIIRWNGANGDFQIWQTGGVIRLTNGSRHILMDPSGNLYPTADNAQMLGTGSTRWSAVYSATGTIQTSDEQAKLNIQNLDEQQGLALLNNLKPINYTYKDQPEGKMRMGFGARATQAALASMGYNQNAVVDQSGKEWGMTYTELIAPLVKAVQQLSARLIVAEQTLANIPNIKH